jgi:peptide-methionine (R)-S-oxide reductase
MMRTEVRSRMRTATSGTCFPMVRSDRGGLRYCINSASLRFIHRDDMEAEGYGRLPEPVEDVQ